MQAAPRTRGVFMNTKFDLMHLIHHIFTCMNTTSSRPVGMWNPPIQCCSWSSVAERHKSRHRVIPYTAYQRSPTNTIVFQCWRKLVTKTVHWWTSWNDGWAAKEWQRWRRLISERRPAKAERAENSIKWEIVRNPKPCRGFAANTGTRDEFHAWSNLHFACRQLAEVFGAMIIQLNLYTWSCG